jgi:hypothetical protein
MKGVIVIFLLIPLFSINSCKQLKNVQFNVSYQTSETIPAEPLVNVTDSISSPPVNTNVANIMKQNNTSTNLVSSVKLQTLVLTITAPEGKRLRFSGMPGFSSLLIAFLP